MSKNQKIVAGLLMVICLIYGVYALITTPFKLAKPTYYYLDADTKKMYLLVDSMGDTIHHNPMKTDKDLYIIK